MLAEVFVSKLAAYLKYQGEGRRCDRSLRDITHIQTECEPSIFSQQEEGCVRGVAVEQHAHRVHVPEQPSSELQHVAAALVRVFLYRGVRQYGGRYGWHQDWNTKINNEITVS